MIKKQCIICGKEFEVANSCYCLCSDECRKARAKIQNAKHNADQKYTKKKQTVEPKIVLCKICSKPVEPYFFDDRMCRKYYHESCVLSEALQAVSEGAGFDDKRIRRANNLYGYTVKELREEMCDV